MPRGPDRNTSSPAGPSEPRRTCVGCRGKLGQSELLRFRRRRDGHVVLAIGRREADGRGAWLCPRPSCFAAAERQRSFGRAFATTHGPTGRKSSPPSGHPRATTKRPVALETHFEPRRAWTDTEARLRSEIDLLDRSAANPHEHPRRCALARLVVELTSQPAPPERGSAASSRKGKGGSPTHG